MQRKRDGGEGQQSQLVPPNFEFNEVAIRGFLDTSLPEGVLIENIATLKELKFIAEEQPQAGKTRAHGTVYKITPPQGIRVPA